jgi:NADPH:quinone reductase-like Zn-dependent oxidoreductase
LNATAKVIITSSSDKKLAEIKTLLQPLIRPNAPSDVLQTINYNTTPEWDKEVAKLTDGAKVDFVIEISGRATLGKSIRSTRSGGLVAISGYLSDYAEMDPKVKEEGTHIPLNEVVHSLTLYVRFRSRKDAALLFCLRKRQLCRYVIHPTLVRRV